MEATKKGAAEEKAAVDEAAKKTADEKTKTAFENETAKIYAQLDIDHDGNVTWDEIKSSAKIGMKTKAWWDKMKMMDALNPGGVTKMEWITFWQDLLTPI